MSNSKPLIVGGIAAFVLVAGWAGASWVTQRAVDARIRAVTDVQDPKVPFRLANVERHGGFRQSRGGFDVLMHAQCDGAGVPDTPVGHASYEVSQGVNPFGPLHVHWRFDVRPKDLPAGAEPMLTVTGDGEADRHGNTTQKVAFAASEKLIPRDHLRIDPMDVTVRMDGAALDARLLLPTVHAVDPQGQALDIRAVSAQLTKADAQKKDGSYAVKVADIVAPGFAVHGISLDGRQKVDHDVMDAHLRYGVASGQVSGKDLKDLVLEMSFGGMAVSDLEALSRAADARCRAGSPEAAPDMKAVQVALGRMLRHGFLVAIDRLSGTVGDGSFDGATRIEVLRTRDGEPVSTTHAIKASGHLRVAGRDLMPGSIEPLVQQHFVVADGDGMKSAFDFSEGRLTVNGTPVDLPLVQLMQAKLDAELAALPADGAAGGVAATGGAAAPAQ